MVYFSSVQSLSCVWLFETPWTTACQASLSITNSPELTQTHVHSVSDAIQPSHPLSSPYPPAFNLSQHQGLFQWVTTWHQVAKLSGLISFRMIDCFDLLAVQGTLKSPVQYQSSKGTILQCSAFFIVQLSHPYMTTGKTIALTRWTLVGKALSLVSAY